VNEADARKLQAPPRGVGASMPRKEDARLLAGQGQFVGDIRVPDLLEVAFVRSPIAHGRLRGVRKPAGFEHAVFTMDDMAGVRPIRAVSGLPGFKPSDQWPLARDKVRQVGETVAMCVAPTRAQAEDIAAMVELELDELPAVVDMVRARTDPPALVHEAWGDNVFLESRAERGAFASVHARAPIVVTRHLRTARQSMAPLEGRAVLCQWDTRLDQLVMHSAAQMPHINRAGLSECLGIDQGRIRVIAPDVGGGFGYKGILLPEEVCLGWLAMRLRRPVRWLEDRREQLTANANCREHDYTITLYAERDGRLLAIDCEATVDSGAYSSYPFSACLEAAQVGSILPGPYRMDGYRCLTWSVATNKPPILPYRGVARTGVCFALEIALDMVAREAGREPWEVRLDALVQPAQMPYTNITGKHFDSGDHPECLRRAVAALDVPGWRERQRNRQPGERRIGIGVAIFCEQGASGTAVYQALGLPLVPGHEQCAARLAPDGTLEVRTGAHSHGQGLETTLAQVAHEELGIDVSAVVVRHGDTGNTPYGMGTFASRSMTMAGGAVSRACATLAAKLRRIGAHLLQVPFEQVSLQDGCAQAGDRRLPLSALCEAAYPHPERLPPGEPPALEAFEVYEPASSTGAFSYATHACTVAVDPGTGTVEVLDYVVCHDCGTMVNPMIVEAQVVGGIAQGLGTALYEEIPYDRNGQPLASTFLDYLIPGFAEVPDVRVLHMETPSPHTRFGIKGMGEGGAIAPPAAVLNAVNDALLPLAAKVDCTPITPDRVLAALCAAEAARGPR